MYSWKLTTNLTNPESPEWEMLSVSTLGADVHSDRKMGFFLSREALKNALSEQGFTPSLSQLTLVNYHELKDFPQLTISLSHTKECGAALIAERKIFRSVGIDIENEGRLVKDSIRERIAHQGDINLRNIEIWCLKEAVFKALMNTGLFPKPIEFGSIEIKNGKWFHSPSQLSGEWELKTLTPFVLALAFLKN